MPVTLSDVRFRGQSGHRTLPSIRIMNDRGDLGNKASAALESYVAPQPGYGDNKTIPEAN
jgi:hypothetical protein